MAEMIYNWLVGAMGTPGEYQFCGIYWWTVAAVAAAVAAVALLGVSRRISAAGKGNILKAVCLFQLGFELLWRLVYLLVKGDGLLCWWPAYPCNLGGILLPVIALLDWKRGKQMFYLFGFVGACLTFAVPEGIFTSDVMVFPILKSVLQHTGLLLIPVLEYASGTYRVNVGDMGHTVAGAVVHLLNSEGICRLLGLTGDYMFFRSGMPFVIPGVPQNVTLSLFALAVLAVLAFLGDWRASVRAVSRGRTTLRAGQEKIFQK